MKIVAAITSQATIQGKDVPGKGLKMKLTNQPVELANMSLIFWSMDWAIAGAVAASMTGAAHAAFLKLFLMTIPVRIVI
ncbi:hypothetical protein GCM10016455_18610 [Aliiroseovarius zhejiangensis]|uniref:Uncharacterized protein n=1 Tax=Aliiroseovarius zhejiangensis TaxID=1632025 RepID=A0ABQ3J1B7_9RHOB|nr:hypothetical protein GCM10016455_18610 [Aliiroseovarius zhejiangensis]